jgi:hypothetical protein
LTESIEFQPDRVLGVVSVVLGTGGIDFEVKGKVAISVSICSAKCCKKSITYTKWQLQADVTAQFESVIPGLGIQLPGGSKIGVIGNIQFGIMGSGTFSETFDKNCNVTCASEVCAGIFGGVGLMAGLKLEGGGDDEELGLEVGIAGSMKGSGTICYGCQGFKAQLCLEGKIELVAKVTVYFVSVGGSYELAGGKICTGYPSS